MSSYRDAQPPGFEITSELKTWESRNKCPRCTFELYAGEKEGSRLEACGRCGGVWMTTEQANRALAVGSRAPEELARKVEAVTRPVSTSASPLPCPECRASMSTKAFGAVTVDVCSHGTWFDRTELAGVMRVMRGEPEPEETGIEAAFLEEHRLRRGNVFALPLEELRKRIAAILDALGS